MQTALLATGRFLFPLVRLRSASAPYFEFYDLTEVAKRPIDRHPDLRGRQWWEGNPAPYLVIV